MRPQDGRLFRLEVVETETITTLAASSRGAVQWEVRVRVDHLVHEELYPKLLRGGEPSDGISWDLQRIHQFLIGAAHERFLRYLERVAVHTSADWLVLNLDPTAYVFLFSTRAQRKLAERLGMEAGVRVGREGQQFFVMTDRRIPESRCYCFHADSHRLYGRIESDESALRLYLSDVVRTAPGHSVVQLTTEEALRFLRAMSRPLHGEAHEGAIAEPRLVRPSLGAEESLPGAFRPERPAESSPRVPSPPKTPSAVEPLPKDGRCPVCGDRLLYLSDTEALCLSCDWSNLPPISS